jgi:hypothetical protein
MQSQNFAEVSLEERQRLRRKMPKGFNVYITKTLNVRSSSVCKWFKNDFNSERIFTEVKKLAKE